MIFCPQHYVTTELGDNDENSDGNPIRVKKISTWSRRIYKGFAFGPPDTKIHSQKSQQTNHTANKTTSKHDVTAIQSYENNMLNLRRYVINSILSRNPDTPVFDEDNRELPQVASVQ